MGARAVSGAGGGPRDLGAECAAALVVLREATAKEVARSVQARDSDVRAVMQGDPRFMLVRQPKGRKHNARVYALAQVPVPARGTRRDQQTGIRKARVPARVSGQLTLPLGGASGE